MSTRSIDAKTHATLFHDAGYRAYMLTREGEDATYAFGRRPPPLARHDAARAFAGLRHLIDRMASSIAKARLHRLALRLNSERA